VRPGYGAAEEGEEEEGTVEEERRVSKPSGKAMIFDI